MHAVSNYHQYPRARVIYQNEFLYTSFDATGYHFENHTSEDSDCSLRNVLPNNCSGNLVQQLHRIQSINYSINTNYVNVNQFGQASRIDGTTVTSPDITLDFEYFLSDGYNEQAVGFIIDGEHQALSKHMRPDGRFGSNFFITTGPEGHDIINSDLNKFKNQKGTFNAAGQLQLPFPLQNKNPDHHITTMGIGNAFLSQYSVTAEVGSLPRARLSFDAFNMSVYKGFCNLPVPSINPNSFCDDPNIHFSIPDTYESFVYGKLQGMEDITLQGGVPGLRPTDIRIRIGEMGSISKYIDDEGYYGDGAAHIQGFTINIPIGTTKLNRIGTKLAFTRALNFPATITIQIRAVVSELKKIASAVDDFCSKRRQDIILELYDCRGLVECNGSLNQVSTNMKYVIKGASLESESFSLDIGDNKVVDMTATASVAGPEDLDNGFFLYGKSHLPSRPQILSWGKSL